MIYFYNLKLQYYNKKNVNGSNFDHIASISVQINMKTSITMPRELMQDQDRYRDKNLNGTGTGANHRDQK